MGNFSQQFVENCTDNNRMNLDQIMIVTGCPKLVESVFLAPIW